MTPVEFAHAAINCRDMAAIERYYTKHFGFRRARVIPLGQDQIVFLKLGGVYLELFRAASNSPLPPPSGDGYSFPGIRHIAFHVEDIDAVLQAMGPEARIAQGPMNFDDFIKGWRTVWLQDPEGNIVEVSQGYTDQTNPPAMTE